MDLVRRLLVALSHVLPSPRVIYSLDGVSPYLSRWYLYGRPRMPDGSSPFTKFGNPKPEAIWPDGPGIYLHRFHRGDNEPELHNHPFGASASLILAGGYVEERLIGDHIEKRTLRPGDINVIGHDTFHRVELPDGQDAWSLFVVSGKVRSWGFLSAAKHAWTWLRVIPHKEFFAERSRELRARTHCPECGRARVEDLMPPEACLDCRRAQLVREERARFAAAAKIDFALHEGSFFHQGGWCGAEGEDRARIARSRAFQAEDGRFYVWAATPTRAPAIDLCETIRPWVDDWKDDFDFNEDLSAPALTQIMTAEKLLNEALASSLTGFDNDNAVALILPEAFDSPAPDAPAGSGVEVVPVSPEVIS